MADRANPADLPAPGPTIMEEAADWALTLRYDDPDPAVLADFDRWHSQGAAQAEAWNRAQAVFRKFEIIPAQVGKHVLTGHTSKQPAGSRNRRDALRMLVGAGLVTPAAVVALRTQPWREWMADQRTAVGERRLITLPDGSEVVLNTASALDVAFASTERRLRLVAGEIMIATQPDPRPFLVETAHGTLRALGTRFAVREMASGALRVSVFEHAVEISPPGRNPVRVNAGEQAFLDQDGVGARSAVDQNARMWEQGMLLAQNSRLGDVVEEISRYRRGILRCDPTVADLQISGAMMLADTDMTLDLLAQSLPVKIVRRSRWWVTVTAAD